MGQLSNENIKLLVHCVPAVAEEWAVNEDRAKPPEQFSVGSFLVSY
jgi:hypothetical protein